MTTRRELIEQKSKECFYELNNYECLKGKNLLYDPAYYSAELIYNYFKTYYFDTNVYQIFIDFLEINEIQIEQQDKIKIYKILFDYIQFLKKL